MDAILTNDSFLPDDLSNVKRQVPPSLPSATSEKQNMEMPPKRQLGYLSSYIQSHEIPGSSFSTSTINQFGTGFGDSSSSEPLTDLNQKKQRFGKDKQASDIFAYDTSSDRQIGNKWPTDSLRDFLYEINEYQDPTYLGFEIIFVADESPLFNYDRGEIGYSNSALKFIQKYSDIDDMSLRENILYNFLSHIKQMFAVSTDSESDITVNKRHYVQDISGLDKLTNKIVDYEKDLIEITLNEDVSLRTQYLVDLYNNLTYDYKYKKNMIPENTLRFDMLIKVSDIRNFKVENPDYDPIKNPDREVFTHKYEGGTYTLYKLHDCNFDFSKSQTHESTMSIGGWSSFNSSNMNNTKFSIKYKSISKVFESMLVDKYEIVKLNTHDLTSLSADYFNDSFAAILYNQDYKYMKTVDNSVGGVKNSLIEPGSPLKDKLKKPNIEKYKKIVDNNIDKGKKQLLNKFNEVRGELISDVIKEIRNLTFLPNKLGNVYSTDFRQLSLENFATGLGNDLFDKAAKDVTGIAMNATDLFKQNKQSDDSYLGDIDDITKK